MLKFQVLLSLLRPVVAINEKSDIIATYFSQIPVVLLRAFCFNQMQIKMLLLRWFFLYLGNLELNPQLLFCLAYYIPENTQMRQLLAHINSIKQYCKLF